MPEGTLATIEILPSELQVGDVIVSPGDKVKVEFIEPRACSKRGTHVNEKYCFNQHARLVVKRASE